jgi:hypothetical protein
VDTLAHPVYSASFPPRHKAQQKANKQQQQKEENKKKNAREYLACAFLFV